MAKYDINDSTDLDIMRSEFDMYTHEDWDDYIELAEANDFSYKNVNILKSASRKAGIAKYLSPKMINWVLELIDQLDELDEDEDE